MPHIWSAEIKELEKLSENLKGQIPDLEKELVQLIRSDDPNVILLYSRRCLEVIIIDLCEKELNRPRKTEPLKGIIDKLHHEEKVPEHIITSMHGLNDLSTFGTHPKEFDPEQVRPVLINLATIVKWYMKFRNIEIQKESEIKEHITDEPVQEGEAKSEQKIQSEKGETAPGKKHSRIIFYIAVILVIIIIGIVGGKLYLKQKKINYAR